MPDSRARSVKSLRAHPRNAAIYGVDPVTDLTQDLAEHGMLEPVVVSPAGVIISGHRRVRAAKALGWKTVPARIDDGPTTAARLVSFNRQRRKTWSQIYQEAMVLLPDAKRRAAERRASRGPTRRVGAPARALTEVATELGLKREALRRLVFIHDLHESAHLPDYVLDRLNTGKWTLHKAFLHARSHAPANVNSPLDADGRWLRMFDLWSFRHTEVRLGASITPGSGERRGAHAPQVFANLVHYFSPPGGLVADPMAGGGAVHDACNALGRRCVSLDLSPARPFIRRSDARAVPPDLTAQRFDLVVLDPPYGRSVRYSRKRADLSNIVDVPKFLQAVDECARSWQRVLRPEGYLAVLMGNLDRDGLCTDLAWQVGRLLEAHMAIVRRIWVPYVLTERTGIRAARAARFHRLATRQCEIFVCRTKTE